MKNIIETLIRPFTNLYNAFVLVRQERKIDKECARRGLIYIRTVDQYDRELRALEIAIQESVLDDSVDNETFQELINEYADLRTRTYIVY